MSSSSCTCPEDAATIAAKAVIPATPAADTRAAWPAVASIAVGTFAMVSTEFLPIGLLTDIARGMDISDGTAGLVVTMPGVLAAFAGPLLAVLAGRIDRRVVMLGLTAMLLVSNVLAALATNFATLLVARLLLGASVGGFWSFAPGVASQLVPAASQARAVSLVLAGVSASTVLGVPAGAAIGNALGWRAAFAVMAVLTAVVLVVQLLRLPSVPSRRSVRPADLLIPLTTSRARAGLLAVVLMVAGHFATYTYLKPLLLELYGLSAAHVTALLLTYGVAGFAGNFAVGAIVARNVRAGLVATTGMLAIALLASVLLGSGVVAGAALVVLWGVAFGMVPGAATAWMLDALPEAPEAGQAMLVTSFQVAIASGAALGGRVVDHGGIAATMLFGAALAAAAMLAAGTLGRRVRSAAAA